jgi:hypothetical protein
MLRTAVAVTLVWCMLLAPEGRCQSARELFAEAKTAEAEGKKDVAFLLYRQLLRQYPESGHAEEALFLVGQYYYDFRNFFDADQTFREYLKKYSRGAFSKPSREYLGRIRLRSLKERADNLFEEGKLGPASVLYHQYLKIDPDNAEVQAQLKQITETLQEVHFGFEQLHREQKELELEKKELARRTALLEEKGKELQKARKEAEELAKATAARYEERLALLNEEVLAVNKRMAGLHKELNGWRARATIAEAVGLSEPFPGNFKSSPGEKELPLFVFGGGKSDPFPEEGEAPVADVAREGFPAVVITQSKMDAKKKMRQVEAVVSADLNSAWPEGMKLKFRVDFVGKEGKPAPDPQFVVRYYEASDMDDINQANKSYKKRVVFAAEEERVSRYEVSAFLVRTE